MMRPRLFAEFPAGLAAVSLRLHGGAYCRPPISRQGSKVGFGEVVLAALGLQSGQGAGSYWWGEADPDVAALLRAYPDAALLRRVAEIIRGWSSEEPRALWTRLREERKARGPREDAEGTAAWTWIQGHGSPDGRLAAQYLNPEGNAAGSWAAPPREWLADRCHRLAEYATIQSMNRLVCMADDGTGALMNTGNGGTRFGGEFATPPEDVAGAFERVAGEVASHAFLHQGSFQYKGPDAGIGRPEGMEAHDTHGAVRPVSAILADSFPRLASGWPPVRVTRTIPTADEIAEALGTPGDLEGVVVYMDPPYVGTTGYAHNLRRDEVVRFARGYDAMGAVVCVSESVPVEELTSLGWHSTDIAGGRKGQRRTFARVATEALTMNREPAHVVATQTSMFTFGGSV